MMEAQIAAGAVERTGVSSLRAALGVYLELAKARLAMLVLLTTVVGYVLAARGHAHLDVLLWTVLGTALTAFGANILNQWWETDRDALMERTRTRPLPSGRLSRARALRWGVLSSLIGLVVLAAGVNVLTAALSLAVILLYVLVYTPMKVVSPLNTVVGAVCGAIPPMMGWTAATGRVEAGAWVLFGLLFVWQVPHFFALAWMYRDDYARGGYRMLPAVDGDGAVTARMAFLWAAALLPLAAALTGVGVTGTVFLVASQLLGVAFALLGWRFLKDRSRRAARNLFLASVLYLPALLGLMVVDMDERLSHAASLAPRAPAAPVATADPGLALARLD